MTETLPEVAVADAAPGVAAIYEKIMRHTGVGSPALIYRHFAVYPDFLDWVWAAVGPELESGHALAHALAALDSVPPVPLPAMTVDDLAGAGLDADGRAMTRAMLATYNRMNPVNFSLISAVRAVLVEPSAPADETAILDERAGPIPDAAIRLPAPVALDAMPADVRDAVLSLSAAIPSPGTQVIPTLYRHFAIWPDLIRLVAPALQTAMDDGLVAGRMAMLGDAMQAPIADMVARARRRALPPAPLADKAAMVRTLESFLFTIPQLVVVGTALAAAMPAARA